MVTLARRATPSQRRILRAVEGAVKNTGDAHPEYQITPRMARSIAKRAAGTLTASWPDTLAARSASSDRAAVSTLGHPSPLASQIAMARGKGIVLSGSRRSPLHLLWKELSIKVGAAKRDGKTERAAALIEVLQRIATFQREGRV